MFFPKIYRYRLFGISMDLRYVMFLNAYIKAISLFPDITPKENRELSKLVIFDILGRSHDLKNKEEKKEAAEQLRESLFSDEEIMDSFANYFLIECFCFSCTNADGHNKDFKEKADKALSKAKLYKNTAEPISVKDVNNINKEINKKRKILNKSIEKETSKTRKPIKIQPSIIFIFISVFSSIFLVGGFLYTVILLSFFGINSSDFFDISDYIASSVDIIFFTLLTVFFGLFGYFIVHLSVVSEIIKIEQLDNRLIFGGFWNSVLVIAGIMIVVYGTMFYVALVYYDSFTPELLSPLAFVILISIFFTLLKRDKYIENRFIVRTVVVSIFGFLAYMGTGILGTLYEIKNENYKSPYTVFFTEEYKEYSDHAFFLANSKYAFFLNKKTKETVVIPKTGIKAIQTKSEP